MPRMLALMLAILPTLAGCHRLIESMAPSGPAAVPTEPLRIAAASDLQAVLPVVIEAFTERTGIVVAPPTFGASGQLAEQIRQGAPFDLFLAADESYARRLADDGTVRKGSVAVYALGTVVLVASLDATPLVERLDDLKKPEIRRVALANPDFAPYGAAAKKALEAAGLWDDLQPKLVRAESVRQALQFAQTGNADAALVGQSIARDAGLAIVPLDPKVAPPIPQALGVVAASRRADDADAFAKFLLGEGRSILADHGFGTPE